MSESKSTVAMRLAEAAFDLGTGPAGHPWAVAKIGPDKFCLADLRGRGVKDFAAAIGAEYTRGANQILDGKTARDVAAGLRGMAQRGALLPSVTRADEVAAGVVAPPAREAPADADQPRIHITHEGPPDVRNVMRFMRGRDDLFSGGAALMRIVRDVHGRVVAGAIKNGSALAMWLSDRAYVYELRQVGTDEIEFECFLPYGHLILEAGEFEGIPVLLGVSRVPVVRRDGTIRADNGYDPDTGRYFDIDPDLLDLNIPAIPTTADVAASTATLLALYSGFPFVEPADMANALACGLSVYVRAVEPVRTPIFCASAGSQSTGKTLVAQDVPAMLAGGEDTGQNTIQFTPDEDEVRKNITSLLLGSAAPILCFDNIPIGTTFESAVVARAATAAWWNDRKLGKNENVTVPQDRILTVTGNNLSIGSDIRPRAVLIRIDAKDHADPAQRQFGVRLDDPATLKGLRREAIKAALTVVRAWVLAGAPEAVDVVPMRQFTRWSALMGGLLEFMGVEGFLANRGALDDLSDSDAQMAKTLWALWAEFGEAPFTAADVVEFIEQNPDIDDALPVAMAALVKRDPPPMPQNKLKEGHSVLRQSVGNTFRERKNHYFAGVRVEPAADKPDRTGRAWWRLRVAPGLPGLPIPPILTEKRGGTPLLCSDTYTPPAPAPKSGHGRPGRPSTPAEPIPPALALLHAVPLDPKENAK